jgi:hypothetical protein
MKYGANGSTPPRMPYVPDNSSYRQPQLQAPIPTQSTTPRVDPRVRFDRITSTPRHNAEGQVVGADRAPQGRSQVLFVNADRKGDRQSLTTDHWGRFQTTLASGNWLVYVKDASGRLIYQQKVEVAEGKPTVPMTLVSR